MKIEKKDTFIGESYNIIIEQKDNLEPLDIAESFKRQFPKEKAVISFSRIVQIEVGILFVNIKLPKIKKQGDKE